MEEEFRPSWPAGYLITFSCYGRVVHGEERPTVDRHRNLYGSRFIQPKEGWAKAERALMRDSPYVMDLEAREIVVERIRGTAEYRGWVLFAVHALKNHVHAVVRAEVQPERVMLDLKAYASRGLNERYGRKRRYWARHGSTKWLFTSAKVNEAVRYVVEGQEAGGVVFVGGE